MAKSCMNLKSGQSKSLELDYLRILYAMQKLGKDKVKGYFMVGGDNIRKRMITWDIKYKAEGCIAVLVPKLTSREKELIRKEKAKNAKGISGKNAKEAAANKSEKLFEDKLVAAISQIYPKAKRISDTKYFPFGIRWDYCAKVDSRR